MFFRRLIVRALGVGILAGILLSAIQVLGVSPIILAAEEFEGGATVATADAHGGHGHSHEHDHGEAWAPADGTERTAATVLSNVFVAIGFSAVILSLMNAYQLKAGSRITAGRGVLWGLAGFFAFFLAPSLGMPPEIPGAQAAELSQRQWWWLLTVLCTVAGFAAIVLLSSWRKVVGSILLVLPHAIGAPHLSGPMFAHTDPSAVAALTDLHRQFMLASGLTNLLFWLVLGVACAWTMARFSSARTESNAAA